MHKYICPTFLQNLMQNPSSGLGQAALIINEDKQTDTQTNRQGVSFVFRGVMIRKE